VRLSNSGASRAMGGGSSRPTLSSSRPLGQTANYTPSLDASANALLRNWNEEFQLALELIDKEEYARGYAQLAR
jgi:hypothetical protein